MRTKRPHPKVFLAWGRWWAFQLQFPTTLALGVRLELSRPMLDIYIGPATCAIGRHPILSSEGVRHSDSCRGFLFDPNEVL